MSRISSAWLKIGAILILSLAVTLLLHQLFKEPQAIITAASEEDRENLEHAHAQMATFRREAGKEVQGYLVEDGMAVTVRGRVDEVQLAKLQAQLSKTNADTVAVSQLGAEARISGRMLRDRVENNRRLNHLGLGAKGVEQGRMLGFAGLHSVQEGIKNGCKAVINNAETTASYGMALYMGKEKTRRRKSPKTEEPTHQKETLNMEGPQQPQEELHIQ